MNGSQRISRSGRSMNSRSTEAKKVGQNNGCPINSEKVEFCREDRGFLDSWDSSIEFGSPGSMDQKKETDGWESSSPVEMAVTEEEGSCSDKVVYSSEDNSTLAVWITYKRASKSKGVGSREKPSKVKQNSIGVIDGKIPSELEQISRLDLTDRYAKKYSKKRRSTLEMSLNEESGGVSC